MVSLAPAKQLLYPGRFQKISNFVWVASGQGKNCFSCSSSAQSSTLVSYLLKNWLAIIIGMISCLAALLKLIFSRLTIQRNGSSFRYVKAIRCPEKIVAWVKTSISKELLVSSNKWQFCSLQTIHIKQPSTKFQTFELYFPNQFLQQINRLTIDPVMTQWIPNILNTSS